jgi:hypothetical protein
MSLPRDLLRRLCLPRLAVFVCITFPLLVSAQGLTSPDPADPPFATDTADSLAGMSSARSLGPHATGMSRVPTMQKEFTEASGFNWAQFFKGAVQTGSRLADPRLFRNSGPGESGAGGSFYHAGTGFREASGSSFDASARGVNFSTKSAGLDLHLSMTSMFAGGFSRGEAGSSFIGSGLNGTDLGGLGTPRGLGDLGGRDTGKGSGAKISLQLKF